MFDGFRVIGLPFTKSFPYGGVAAGTAPGNETGVRGGLARNTALGSLINDLNLFIK